MPPILPYRTAPTPAAEQLSEWMSRQWLSPYSDELMTAAVFIASGQELKAALLVRQVIRGMEDLGVNLDDMKPIMRLSGDAWRRAAARFAITPTHASANLRQRIRNDLLLEALAVYKIVEDIPEQIRIMRAIAKAKLSRQNSNAAVGVLANVFDLAKTQLALGVSEFRQLIVEMATAAQTASDLHSLPDAAIQTAALRQSLGENDQAVMLLGKASERFLDISKIMHQRERHAEALKTLTEAIQLGMLAGLEDVFVQHADLLIKYSALTGDVESLQVYERSLHLTGLSMRGAADHLIQDRARVILSNPDVNALAEFHRILDSATQYPVAYLSMMTKDNRHQEPEFLEAALAQMDGMFWQNAAWVRTLDMMQSLQHLPNMEKRWEHGVASLQYTSAQYRQAMHMAAAHYRLTRRRITSASPSLIEFVAGADFSDPNAVWGVYARIAQELELPVSEVAGAFSPYGDARVRVRLQNAMGHLPFAHVQSAVLSHEFEGRRQQWLEVRGAARGVK